LYCTVFTVDATLRDLGMLPAAAGMIAEIAHTSAKAARTGFI
jgi:hypothetical protein